MRGQLYFRVLGPLTVERGGVPLALGAPQQRAVLGVLLLHANRVVSVDRLADALWGDRPPASFRVQIQGMVSDLRKTLGTDGRRADAPIETEPPGYRLCVSPDRLDLEEFRHDVTAARGLLESGDLDAAGTLFHAALARWRGPAFHDVACPIVQQAAAGLEEARLAALEDRIEVDLLSGRHAEVIGELGALVAEHTLRERFHAQLMTALARSGRRAEALHTYLDVRTRLIEELGVEPGPELRRVHAMTLAGDLGAGTEAGEPRVAAAAAAPVCQLPADIPDFSGRADLVRELTETLTETQPEGRGTGRAPAAVVVAGPPGAGKSTLALHVAHAVRAAFPDGQLYADLGGTTPAPREPGELLAEVLFALGVAGAAVPKRLSERVALYRTKIADRRMLVVLDDAATAAQVRPLLPTTAGCAVIVTSRHRLAELPGARPVVLDALRPDEARELIERIVGRERVEREPQETAAILQACGYLPLAIRIAGAKLAGRKAWTLRVLRERLEDESRRVSELQVGDLGVRTSFEMSMHLLPEPAARAFGLLGALGAQTFPGWVLDALLDRRADDALDTLLDAHLLHLADVDPCGRPRYRLHDLLRAYAQEVAAGAMNASDDGPRQRRAALGRALGGWLGVAERAADHLPATVNRMAPTRTRRWLPPPAVIAAATAAPLDWFEAERRSLLTGVGLAAEHGLDDLAWELAVCLVPYLDHLSLYEDWRAAHQQALRAVRAAGNRRGEAALLRGLGQLSVYWDDYPQAVLRFERSRDLSQEIGDRRGEAWAVSGLGTVARMLGRHEDAIGHYLQALPVYQALAERRLEAQTRNSIGSIRLAQGRVEEATTWLGEALRIAAEIGDDFRTSVVLVNIGNLHRQNDDPRRALECHQQALTALERHGDHQCVAYARLGIAETYAALQEPEKAAAFCAEAKAIFARNGNRSGVTSCARLLATLAAPAAPGASAPGVGCQSAERGR